ncbi:MAG: HAD family hydrolase [Candidatus Nealsonbacteria bacterium]|nr:HAD family hydrolase [Candidatus Nealsonbacteria bacterium]
MSYQSILFDLDGTLLNTLEDIAESSNFALRHLGFPEHSLESYKYLIGDGLEALVRDVLPEDRCDAAMRGECAALIRKEYGQRWDRKTRPYEGVAELLDAVTAREIPMAILSNKPDDLAKLCVARLLPRWQFAAVIGARPSVPKKPDPAGTLEIAKHLRGDTAEIVYLGDTGTDMKTATAVGMFPVGALWGFRAADELTAAGAEVLISKPLELLDVFDA